MEMCKEWLEKVGQEEARKVMRYFLRRALQPDGSIKMTVGYTSELTVHFTNILSSCEAFSRDGVLTVREKDICLARFGRGLRLRQIAKEFNYSRQTIDNEIRTATDRIVAICCCD